MKTVLRFRIHGLATIALLAQTLFCIAAAPVFDARQEALRPRPTSRNARDLPTDTGVVIQAAVNVANIRPEEVSDAEQKRSSGRGWIRGSLRTADANRSSRLRENDDALARDRAAVESSEGLPSPAEMEAFLRGLSQRDLAIVVPVAFCDVEWRAPRHFLCVCRPVAAESHTRALRESAPAIQPTGPPMSAPVHLC